MKHHFERSSLNDPALLLVGVHVGIHIKLFACIQTNIPHTLVYATPNTALVSDFLFPAIQHQSCTERLWHQEDREYFLLLHRLSKAVTTTKIKPQGRRGEKISACTSRAPPASYLLSFVLWRGISPLRRETSLSRREMWLVILSVLPSPPLSSGCRGPSAPSCAAQRESQFWTRPTPWHPWGTHVPTFPKPAF